MEISKEEMKCFKEMDKALTNTYKNYISLNETECKQNNIILKKVLDKIIEKLQEKSPFFKLLYQKIFYGGSYYDGLKISKPEEYDLDILLTFPSVSTPQVTCAEIPGYVNIKLTNLKELLKHKVNFAPYYCDFENLLDNDHYIVSNKVLSWMEKILSLALNEFEKNENKDIEIPIDDALYLCKICKGGPALTLKLWSSDINSNIKFDVDLVPCIVFTKNNLPIELTVAKQSYFGEGTQGNFFVVPKPIQTKGTDIKDYRCWRLSFQEQEFKAMNGLNNFKPALKLMKKFRDHLQHKKIASYYLKTVFLWSIDSYPKAFWCSPQSLIFLEMLKKYHAFLSKKYLPYFWNETHNLISGISDDTISNFENKIKNVINDIEQNKGTDPYVIVKYLVKKEELEKLKIENMAIDLSARRSDEGTVPVGSSSEMIVEAKQLMSDIQSLMKRFSQLGQDLNKKVDKLENLISNIEANQIHLPEPKS